MLNWKSCRRRSGAESILAGFDHRVDDDLSSPRYARVDRRPLDPPPAVLLRVFEVNRTDSGRQWEREIKAE